MTFLSKLRNSLILALGILLLAPLAGPDVGVFGIGVEAAQAQTINRISVEGNTRVDDATVISYLTVRVGDQATAAEIAASTDALLATGLFSSVNISISGGTLRVRVIENAIVGSVLFEGNTAIPDSQLSDMVELNSRGTYTDALLQTDIQTIRLAYDQRGYRGVGVTARTETMDNARIRVIFTIDEGQRAGVAAISFSGNASFDSGTLRNVLTTRETHLLSWLFRDDVYDEDRMNLDSEMIRRFYVNHGFPDVQILSAVSEYDASRNAYFITFTISEGERYTFGDIGIETSIAGLDTEALKSAITTYEGNNYSQEKLQRSMEDLGIQATDQGFAFAEVRPRLHRDIASHTFSVTYLIDEGARAYVERVNITGNTKTRDFVIRRELDFAEGDPFNRTLVSRGKSKIEALGFFKVVNISTTQGSASDKVVINIDVVESATGDYGLTAGYDTSEGILGEISLTERNFLGRGQYMRISAGATESGRTYTFSFTEPRFMGLNVSAGTDIYQHITDESSSAFYGTKATGGKLRFGMPITNEFSSSVYVGFEQKTFTDNDPDDSALVDDGETRNSLIAGYSLNYSTVDSQTNPTRGLYATLTQQIATVNSTYLRSDLKARYFMPLLEESGIVASVKGQAGIINSLDGTDLNPIDTFFPGSDLVRGFQSYGIGPRSTVSGEIVGVTWYAGISGEIEFPLPIVPESYGLSGSVWADAGYFGDTAYTGGVTTGSDDPLRASVGASLIWDSPFGPLRGDFAQVVSKDTDDKAQFFTLSLKTLL